MNICVLTHTFPRNQKDSAAAFMKEFCDGLVENGHKVVVVTPFDKEFRRQDDSFKIVTYKYIWPLGAHLLGYSRSMEADIEIKKINYLLVPFMVLFGFFALLKTIRREKIDVVSVHWILPNGLIAWLTYKITKIPYVVTLPGTDVFLVSKYKFLRLIAKMIALNASGIFSNSQWHLDKVLNLGVKPYLTGVITYPVNVDKFKPSTYGVAKLRTDLGYQDKLVLLAVGRLVYKKGFDYLIKAMPKVIKQFPNTRLIIGGSGDLLKEWQELATDLKVSNYIFFAGSIPRDVVSIYYNMADIMVTPSVIDQKGNIDGRPLVILESMACGKAQIVTNLPGISEGLKDQVNGLLVEQRNESSLSEAILKLLSSPGLRKKMGDNNRKLAQEEFSTEQIGKRYSEVFRKALDYGQN
ncbi:MAG: glycosyltransferase family 4 protein [Candidatus Daviesbacteria bacterium]|nr:glycosyltransferase family 4 protein [Candidatus Daviesbacteria bacterium]